MPVLELAEREIRRRQLIPTDLSIKWIPYDDKCDASYATISAMDGYGIDCGHVLFGPTCEYALGKWQIPFYFLFVRLQKKSSKMLANWILSQSTFFKRKRNQKKKKSLITCRWWNSLKYELSGSFFVVIWHSYHIIILCWIFFLMLYQSSNSCDSFCSFWFWEQKYVEWQTQITETFSFFHQLPV